MSTIKKYFVFGLSILSMSAIVAPAGAAKLETEELTLSEPLMMDSSPMINPADKAKPSQTPAQEASGRHLRSYELPPVEVIDSPLREEQRVGSYGQPVWTASRRFPGVRTYVIPEGQVEFEYWMRADVPKHGDTEIRHMYELEFGLPYRFQLDLYAVARTDQGGDSEVFFDQMIEVRYAFADYGKIWGNPTLYVEYANRDQKSDKVEIKGLFTGELKPGWHWGQNLLFEADTGGDREYEYGWTGGISYTVIDQVFSVGAEAQASVFDVQNDRGNYRDEIFVGPSVQWRPAPQVHLDVAPLFGITGESPLAKILFVFGYEF